MAAIPRGGGVPPPRDVTSVPAGRIQQKTLPQNVNDLRPQFACPACCQIFEYHVQSLRVDRNGQMERVHIGYVAAPCHIVPIDLHLQACELHRRACGRMAGCFPLGIEQDHIARILKRQRLPHMEDPWLVSVASTRSWTSLRKGLIRAAQAEAAARGERSASERPVLTKNSR